MGWPNRPGRAAFGPTYRNSRPVENPEQDVDASIANLLFWQVPGLCRVSARAVIAFSIKAGPDVDSITYQGMVWDPDSELTPIAVTRTGTGIYQLVFAEEYPDEQGTDVPLVLEHGEVKVQGTTARHGQPNFVNNYTVEARIFDMTGAPADPAVGDKVLVILW